MITLQGTLLNPMQQVMPNALIRFTALSTEDVLVGMSATHKTDVEGNYLFPLELGRYLLEILYTDEYHETGVILVDEYTPTELTLAELKAYATPYTPPIVSDSPTDWEEKFTETRAEDEWSRLSEEQVRDGDTLSNEQKQISKKEEQYLATEDFTQRTKGSVQATQFLTYSDDQNNFAAVSAQKIGTLKLGNTSEYAIYESSNGDELLREKVTFSGSNTEGNFLQEFSNTGYLRERAVSLDETQEITSLHFSKNFTDEIGVNWAGEFLEKSTSYLAGEGVHQGEIYSKDEVKYFDSDDLTEVLFEKGVQLNYSREGNLLEGFYRMEATLSGVVETRQVDKSIVQGRDGQVLLECDTEANTVEVKGKLIISNPDDFKGEDGSTLDWVFDYSSDKGASDPWHVTWVEGDVWRRDTQYRLYADGSRTPTGVIEYVRLTAQDGAAGDSYYLQTQYTTEEDLPQGVWRDAYAVKDDWRRQREVRVDAQGNSTIGEWWEPERIRGDDGQDGWVPEVETYYGTDATAYFDPTNPNLADWHKNLVNEDLVKYERTIWWYSQAIFASVRNATYGIDWDKVQDGTYDSTPWVGATKIRGEDGAIGANSSPIFLYKRSTENPTDAGVGVWKYTFSTQTVENVSGNTGGWTVQLPPAGDAPLWVATGRAYAASDVDGNIDNWDVDLMSKNGVKYSVAYLYQVGEADSTAPTLPTIVLNFNFSQQRIVSVPNNNWKVVPPSNVGDGNKVWMTFAPVTAAAESVVEPVAVNDWETATVMVQNGLKGDRGFAGLIVRGFWQVAESKPTAPSGTNLTNVGVGWSETPPTDIPIGSKGWVAYTYAESETTMTGNGSWTGVGQWAGSSGSTIYREYVHSPDNSTWHDDYQEGDRYQRFRDVVDGTAGDWSLPYIFTPQHGVDYFDGADGTFTTFAYLTATTKPTTPTGGTYNGTTEVMPNSGGTSLQDNPYFTEGQTTWVSSNKYKQNADSTWSLVGTWSAMSEFSKQGIDGLMLRIVFKNAIDKPSAPTGTTIPPIGWTLSPSNPAEGYTTWASYTYALGAETSTGNGVWTSVVQQSGTNGSKGKHGQGSFKVRKSSVPSDSVKDDDIATIAERPAQDGDQVNYYWDVTGAEYSRYYNRVDGTWEEVSFVVDGSAVIEDTLAASTLKSGDVFTQKLHIGTTSTTKSEVTLSGSGDATDSTARIWAGATNAEDAPFVVKKDGSVKASDIEATGGFTGANGLFSVDKATGATTIKSASSSSASRLVIEGDRLEVYEGSTLRVRIGRLE